MTDTTQVIAAVYTSRLDILSCYRLDSKGQQRDTDILLRTLVEAEIDGVALTNQLTALKETIDSLAKVNLAPHDHFGVQLVKRMRTYFAVHGKF